MYHNWHNGPDPYAPGLESKVLGLFTWPTIVCTCFGLHFIRSCNSISRSRDLAIMSSKILKLYRITNSQISSINILGHLVFIHLLIHNIPWNLQIALWTWRWSTPLFLSLGEGPETPSPIVAPQWQVQTPPITSSYNMSKMWPPQPQLPKSDQPPPTNRSTY